MADIYPVRDAIIQGVPARMTFRAIMSGDPSQCRTIKEASEAARERQAPADEHNCPLCNDYFSWEEFQAHAAQCIIRHKAGRVHTFLAGPAENAVNNYSGPIKVVKY